MKKITPIIITLTFILSIINDGNAQQTLNNSISKYNSCLSAVQTTANEQIRYNYAIQFFMDSYCTTLQLHDVCYYLKNDEAKYQLCLAAYPKIIDKNNFFNVYNSFNSFAYAMKLYHNTQAKDESLTIGYNHQLELEPDNNEKFNLLIEKGNLLFSSNKFDEAIETYEQAMSLNTGDQTPYLKIKEVNKKKLELADLINKENDKSAQFNLLIQKGDLLLLDNKFDEAIEIYEQAMAMKPEDQTAYLKIKDANIKKQEYIPEEIFDETPIEIVCSVSEEEYSHIMTAIKDQSFSNERKQMAKKYIAKKCFSFEQLKPMPSLFSSDSDKLELIKYMYDYIDFPEKMYQFRDELTFSSSKTEFDQFLVDKEH